MSGPFTAVLLAALVHASNCGGTWTVPAWARSEPYLGPDTPPDDVFTRMHRRSLDIKVYHNAWWQSFRFFAWVHPSDMCQPGDVGCDPEPEEARKQAGAARLEEGVSSNNNMIRAPVTDIHAHARNLRAAYLPGNTLLIDFPFTGYLYHLGHWAELMVPAFSTLMDGSWREDVRTVALARMAGGPSAAAAAMAEQSLDRVLLVNKMKHMSSWFSALLDIVLETAQPGRQKPATVDYPELNSYDQRAWLMVENLIVVQDRYTEPDNNKGFSGTEHGDMWRYDHCERFVSHDYKVGFKLPEHGSMMRRLAYLKAGIPPPEPWQQGTPPKLPRTITLFMPAGPDWPGIMNHFELMGMLHKVAAKYNMRARMMSISPEASFGSHMEVASQSAVLIGRHTYGMANSIFMRPGSMVLELLPYKWEWANISMLYYNITESMGDIHHFAWRPQHYKFAHYSNASYLKYHTWTPTECHAKECLSIQAKAGLIVDLDAVGQLLERKLPAVLAGRPVQELREPWPQAV